MIKNVLHITIRDAMISEALELSDLASRSKAHWPYDKEYLDLCRSVTHVAEDDIRSWHFRVAEINKKIFGFAAVCSVKEEYMLDHLWIEPEVIGSGIGKALFQDAVTCAKRMGWTKFTIAADPYAEKFYIKMGAKRIGERESKIRPGFFLPLLEYDIGLILIGDEKVKAIPVNESHENLVELSKTFPNLCFDWDRHHVQKRSKTISLARRSIGEKLLIAQQFLPKGFRLLVKECHRPMSVQREFWDGYYSYLKSKFPAWSDAEVYKECSKLNAPLDVAPHTTGGAVDLTLADDTGLPLDMGTDFNAEPLETKNATYTTSQDISISARRNRQLLMSVMSKAGFVNYPTEWWHWSFGDKYWAVQTGNLEAIYGSVDENTVVNV